MTTLPLSYPQIINYIVQCIVQVVHDVNINLSLGDFLLKHPFTIIYDILEPLSATPPNYPSFLNMITNLQAKVVTLEKGHAGLEVEVKDLRRNMKVEVVARKVSCKPTGLPELLTRYSLRYYICRHTYFRLSSGLISYDHHPLILSLSSCAFLNICLSHFLSGFL